MAPFDRFRRRGRRGEPSPRSGGRDPSGRAVGRSGTVNTRGFLAPDEIEQDLRWPNSVSTYEEMRRDDSSIRGMLSLVQTPIRSAPPTFEPASESDEHLEQAAFAEHALTTQLEGGFDEFLRMALDYLVYGYQLFEEVADLRDVKFRVKREGSPEPEEVEREAFVMAKLEVRLPDTIQKWNASEQDPSKLESIEQFLGDGRDPSVVTIPADRLVIFTHEQQGDDWRGISLLRSAYKPWLYKKKLENVEAIALERSAGFPVCYPPGDIAADDPLLDDVENMLRKIRQGESIYALMPGPKQLTGGSAEGDGWLLEEMVIRGSDADFSGAIARHETAISRNVLAEFMRLGHETTGARATADVQQDPYYQAVEAVANYVESVINDSVIRDLIDWNYQTDEYPKISFSKIQAKNIEMIGSYIASAVGQGLITPDPELEAWLRKLADAPEAPEGEAPPGTPPGAETPGGDLPPPPGAPPVPTPAEPPPGAPAETPPTGAAAFTADIADALTALAVRPYHGDDPSERDFAGRFKRLYALPGVEYRKAMEASQIDDQIALESANVMPRGSGFLAEVELTDAQSERIADALEEHAGKVWSVGELRGPGRDLSEATPPPGTYIDEESRVIDTQQKIVVGPVEVVEYPDQSVQQATCSACGWVGDARNSRSRAKRDAEEHAVVHDDESELTSAARESTGVTKRWEPQAEEIRRNDLSTGQRAWLKKLPEGAELVRLMKNREVRGSPVIIYFKRDGRTMVVELNPDGSVATPARPAPPA